jgi:hypothetical protein
MQKSLREIEQLSRTRLERAGIGDDIAVFAARACRFLEGVGYPGLKILSEALADESREVPLTLDPLGLDLQEVSCVFLGPGLQQFIAKNSRVFLRNVRHGLYLLPLSVDLNIGIGCPVDPGFALGGERSKNPYVEKLELAEINGVMVDDALWLALERG